ncbi:ubiquitin-protein ligase peroxin 12 [Microbotryomycetes sp. JL221]|nr:ubiquitin-protein ligase peroxin 12 [Microbotryomycetes sp. JL221]
MEFLSDVGGGQDRGRPSFFELAAQEQLRDLLDPVVRYVLSVRPLHHFTLVQHSEKHDKVDNHITQVFAQRHPRYLLRIVNRHDEFFALIMFFVERHYLNAWGASFAENFYGLKRRKVLLGGGGSGTSSSNSDSTKAAIALTGKSDKLGPKEIKSSLAALILLPYLRSKAQTLYEELGGGVNSDLFSDSPASQRSLVANQQQHLGIRLKTLSKTIFKRLWPLLNLSYELYLLSYNVRYIFDKTPFWRPWFSWMNVEVRRMTAEDYRLANKTSATLLSSPFSRHHQTGLRPNLTTILSRSINLIPLITFEALKILLPTSIFFFRFLEWWYSNEGGHSRLTRSKGLGSNGERALRAPSLPQNLINKSNNTTNATTTETTMTIPDKSTCCVHKGPIVNATALPTGWIGCYKCLFKHVEEFGTCPVTRQKIIGGVNDLRKIVG